MKNQSKTVLSPPPPNRWQTFRGTLVLIGMLLLLSLGLLVWQGLHRVVPKVKPSANLRTAELLARCTGFGNSRTIRLP